MHSTQKRTIDRIPLITRDNPQLPQGVQDYVEAIRKHVSLAESDESSREVIKNKWLSSTVLCITKIEKLIEAMQGAQVKKYIIPLNFGGGDYDINYDEFMSYYDFDVKIPEAELGATTSTFQHSYQSKVDSRVWVMYEEFYEHEDDTDSGQYYLKIQL